MKTLHVQLRNDIQEWILAKLKTITQKLPLTKLAYDILPCAVTSKFLLFPIYISTSKIVTTGSFHTLKRKYELIANINGYMT